MIMVLALAGLLLLLAAALTVRHWIKRHGFWVLAWRWHSGHTLDGAHRTNATWLRRSHGNRPVLHNSGSAIWWHHTPRLYRSGIRIGAEVTLLLVLYGLWAAFTLTLAVLAALAVLGALGALAHLAWRLRRWQHERHYVKPLERTLINKLPAAPVSVEVERDDDAVKSVAIEWPPETEIGALEQQQILEAVTTRLAIEAPDAGLEAERTRTLRDLHAERARAVRRRLGGRLRLRRGARGSQRAGLRHRQARRDQHGEVQREPASHDPWHQRWREVEPCRSAAAPGDDARVADLQPGPQVDQPPVAPGPPERHQRPRHAQHAPGADAGSGRNYCAAPRPPTTPRAAPAGSAAASAPGSSSWPRNSTTGCRA